MRDGLSNVAAQDDPGMAASVEAWPPQRVPMAAAEMKATSGI